MLKFLGAPQAGRQYIAAGRARSNGSWPVPVSYASGTGSAARHSAEVLEHHPHEDAVVFLQLAVSVVGALRDGLDAEAVVLVAEADGSSQCAVLDQIAALLAADRPVGRASG